MTQSPPPPFEYATAYDVQPGDVLLDVHDVRWTVLRSTFVRSDQTMRLLMQNDHGTRASLICPPQQGLTLLRNR
jgi:hypothetical protein